MVEGGWHLLHVFPGFDPGGAQMRTVQLMAMLPAGTRHTILAMNGAYGCCQHVPAGVEVHTLPAPTKRSFLAMGRFMADRIVEQQPDAVFTYNWGSIEMLLGARRAGFSPLIHHEDGFGPDESRRYLRRRIWARRLLLRSAVAVAVPSRVLRDLALRRWRQPEAKVHYLPNGVDLDRFRPGGQDLVRRELVVGHVGHLRPEKNQFLLLEAFGRCRHASLARLSIIGDGVEAAALRRRAADLGIHDRVEFRGSVADTAPVYAEMDLFALSSDTEQMPLTVLEAMASGLPVVSTDVGDVRSMLHADNREFLAARGDAADLAGRLDALLADADLRRRLGQANRQHCEAEFDKDSCYRAWVDFYTGVLA